MKLWTPIVMLFLYISAYSGDCYDVDYLNENTDIVMLFHKQLKKDFKDTFNFKLEKIHNRKNRDIDTIKLMGYKIQDPDYKISYIAIIENGLCKEYIIEWKDKSDTLKKELLSKYPCWIKIDTTKYFTMDNNLIKVADVFVDEETIRYSYRYFNGDVKDLTKKEKN